MLGVTGYNTGTLVEHERWREFEDIYDSINEKYSPMFDRFPWIITEFASSSAGGDKAAWIDGMFAALPKYPNIKIAVWFNYADFDITDPYNWQIKRPYWLDETPETLRAFKRGVTTN